MAKLYEYTEQYLILEELLESGEYSQEELADTFEAIEGGANEKAENVAKMIDNLTNEAAMFKAEADRLAKKAKTIQGNADWLTQNLENFLKASGREKLKAGMYQLGYKKLPDVVVFEDEKVIPEAYKTREMVTKISKNDIKKALKDGEEVPGAKMETGRKKFEVKK